MTLDVKHHPAYIPISQINALDVFCERFSHYLTKYLPSHKHELVIVCIGTDRATGDSLGPLVGYKLKDLCYDKVTLLGTLDAPVHAKNLVRHLNRIIKDHPNALVVAIDACLGASKNIGCLTLGEGAIRPGAGVAKDLPAIGDLHITGIVNLSSLMNMVVLQNTRLSLVMQMADLISAGIRQCLLEYYTS